MVSQYISRQDDPFCKVIGYGSIGMGFNPWLDHHVKQQTSVDRCSLWKKKKKKKNESNYMTLFKQHHTTLALWAVKFFPTLLSCVVGVPSHRSKLQQEFCHWQSSLFNSGCAIQSFETIFILCYLLRNEIILKRCLLYILGAGKIMWGNPNKKRKKKKTKYTDGKCNQNE
jgi:hypothetical protein